MKKLLFNLLFLINLFALQAQNAGDYRSAASGNWNSLAAWQRYDGIGWQAAIAIPSSADGVISIRNAHTISVNIVTTVDEIVIDAGGTLSNISTLTLADGAGTDLSCNGTFILFGTLSGAGSGTINNIMNWTGGTLGSVFTIATGAVLNISTAANKSLSSTLTNLGNINWSGGGINFASGTLINNSVFDESIDANFSNLSGTNLFSNAGTFRKIGGNVTNTTIGIPCTNTGTINVNSGTLLKSGAGLPLVNSGTINISAGTIFSNTTTTDLNAGTTITGSGTLVLDGTVNVNTAVSTPSTMVVNKPNGSTNAGTGVLTINGTFNWTGGTSASPVTVAPGATMAISSLNKALNSVLTNNGTIDWSGSGINFNNGSLDNNGTINNSFDGTLSSVTGTNAFTNNGTFNKTAGVATTTIGLPFANNATLNINTGTVTNNGTMNLNAGTILTGNGTLLLSSTVTINANISSSAALTISKVSGTTAGTGIFTVIGTMSWTGGALGSPFTTGATGVLNLSGAGNKTINTVLTNNGTLNWSGGVINNTSATLTNNGTINNSFDGTINNNSGTNTINNTGTFNKTAGAATTTINVPFTNTGSILGQANINFATFVNNGIISPGIATGVTPGILTVASSISPILTANSVLHIDVLDGSGPGTGHSQLVKASSLTLNGTLNVTEIGIVPLGTYTIINLTVGTISGSFATVNLPAGYTLNVGSNTVTITKITVLPIKLLTFSGMVNDKFIDLFWQTTSEENFSHFIIEHSQTGINFSEAGNLPAKKSNTGINNYSFTDGNPFTGNNIYRLKMIDIDGKVEYSKAVNIKFNSKNQFHVFVTADMIIIEGAEKFKQIQIIDMSGRIIKQFVSNTANHYPISDLLKGIYAVKLINNQFIQSLQFIKK